MINLNKGNLEVIPLLSRTALEYPAPTSNCVVEQKDTEVGEDWETTDVFMLQFSMALLKQS